MYFIVYECIVKNVPDTSISAYDIIHDFLPGPHLAFAASAGVFASGVCCLLLCTLRRLKCNLEIKGYHLAYEGYETFLLCTNIVFYPLPIAN